MGEEEELQSMARPLLVVLNKKDLVRPRDLADKVEVGAGQNLDVNVNYESVTPPYNGSAFFSSIQRALWS